MNSRFIGLMVGRVDLALVRVWSLCGPGVGGSWALHGRSMNQHYLSHFFFHFFNIFLFFISHQLLFITIQIKKSLQNNFFFLSIQIFLLFFYINLYYTIEPLKSQNPLSNRPSSVINFYYSIFSLICQFSLIFNLFFLIYK